MLTINELKDLWVSNDFRPVKRLGQNFLIDKNIKDKIITSLEIRKDDTVLEIGPGFGELTFDLSSISQKVYAVEKDKKIINILKKHIALPKNVELIDGDFLDIEIKDLSRGKKLIVYGNLPYYITSSVIEKLIDNIGCIKDIYLVVQKEVAERIIAMPGSKKIGRPSLFIQYYTEPSIVFSIKKDSFFPAPKIESVLIRLRPLEKKKVEVKDEKLLFDIIKAAYMKRRKTIGNSLSNRGIDKKALLDRLSSIGIDSNARPEELSLQDFAYITKIFE